MPVGSVPGCFTLHSRNQPARVNAQHEERVERHDRTPCRPKTTKDGEDGTYPHALKYGTIRHWDNGICYAYRATRETMPRLNQARTSCKPNGAPQGLENTGSHTTAPARSAERLECVHGARPLWVPLLCRSLRTPRIGGGRQDRTTNVQLQSQGKGRPRLSKEPRCTCAKAPSVWLELNAERLDGTEQLETHILKVTFNQLAVTLRAARGLLPT